MSRLDLRNSLICSAVVMVAMLLAWPFANAPLNDDWTWAFTVLQLQKTGHLIYNGWSSPTVIFQAYWALIWVKVFGFSFNVLRLTTWPMAIAAVGICYSLGRRSGLTPAMSAFVALMLGTSPVYLPMASSFMTDVPGVFFMVLSMYAIVRGFETRSRSAAIGWILFGAITALVGGSSRQLVWIVPLAVLPYFAWLRRKDLSFVIGAFLGWMIVFVGAVAVQHWFAQQRYAVPDPPMMAYVFTLRHHTKAVFIEMICVVLTIVQMTLPAGVGLFYTRFGLRDLGLALLRFAIAGSIAVVILVWMRKFDKPLEPWLGNVFTNSGVMGGIELTGNKPEVFGYHSKLIISIVVATVVGLMVASVIIWKVRNFRGLFKRLLNFFLNPQGVAPAIPAMVLLSLAMFGLEITRAISNVAYDRHMLPFIPFAVIPMLIALQFNGQKNLPVWSWALLAAYGLYAVASTQEVSALARARVIAVQRLNDGGINNNQIDAGFEHRYWTQVTMQGHVNDTRIKVPANAYDKTQGPTPAMRIEYLLEWKVTQYAEATRFGTVEYFSLLPPFHRKIYIDRYLDPWWLDERTAATHPVEMQLLPKLLLEQYRYGK